MSGFKYANTIDGAVDALRDAHIDGPFAIAPNRLGGGLFAAATPDRRYYMVAAQTGGVEALPEAQGHSIFRHRQMTYPHLGAEARRHEPRHDADPALAAARMHYRAEDRDATVGLTGLATGTGKAALLVRRRNRDGSVPEIETSPTGLAPHQVDAVRAALGGLTAVHERGRADTAVRSVWPERDPAVRDPAAREVLVERPDLCERLGLVRTEFSADAKVHRIAAAAIERAVDKEAGFALAEAIRQREAALCGVDAAAEMTRGGEANIVLLTYSQLRRSGLKPGTGGLAEGDVHEAHEMAHDSDADRAPESGGMSR